MTARSGEVATAFEVADRIRSDAPWDIFAERARRYEIHLNGRSIEQIRGPIEVEGYGIRVLRSREGVTGVGFQASTDLSDSGVRSAFDDAARLTQYSTFPVKKVDLPSPQKGALASPEIRDPVLWDRPMESLQEYVHALLSAFDGRHGVTPSFGSVRATLTEATLANSAGLRASYSHTTVELEVAVKADGGPEGPTPGEYWVNDSARRLVPSALPAQVEDWCRFAQDSRRAVPPPSGELPVILPASVLAGILPPVVGFRCTGGARLRELAPPIGTQWGTEGLTIHDDGLLPWAITSAPVDDEGTPQQKREVIQRGAVAALFYDVLHAGAFDTNPTGNALRAFHPAGSRDWKRFLYPPDGASTTLVVAPGSGGSDAEVVAAAGDGIWVQQLGWAIPDPISGAFGGELRIGYRIRGGKLAEPVRGGTIGGVVAAPPQRPSLLASIASIGSQPTLVEGLYAPTVLVRPLTVAGTSGPGA